MRERLRVLRHPAFRNLWLASSTSVMGDSIVVVALALFVTDLTGSATDVGIVLAAQMLPLVAFLLIGGVWADRLPRARLMITTDLVRMTLHTLLAVLIFTDQVEIWHLVVIEALFGTSEAFFRPAQTGLVPRTVPEDEIQEAQALSNLTVNLAELVGPALATVLVLGVGAGWAFLLDAATFGVSAWFLTRVRTADVPPPADERGTLLAELAEGFQEVRTRAWLWVTVVVFALAVPLGYAPLFVLGPTLAEDGYGTAAIFGILTTAFGAGALAGALAGPALAAGAPHARRVPGDRRLAVHARRIRPGGARGGRARARGGHRRRLRAVRHPLEHRDGGAHPAARALAGQLVRVDGFADPAAGGLPRRRAGGRGHEPGNRARRGRRS